MVTAPTAFTGGPNTHSGTETFTGALVSSAAGTFSGPDTFGNINNIRFIRLRYIDSTPRATGNTSQRSTKRRPNCGSSSQCSEINRDSASTYRRGYGRVFGQADGSGYCAQVAKKDAFCADTVGAMQLGTRFVRASAKRSPARRNGIASRATKRSPHPIPAERHAQGMKLRTYFYGSLMTSAKIVAILNPVLSSKGRAIESLWTWTPSRAATPFRRRLATNLHRLGVDDKTIQNPAT
jgi:hypothetical protein